VGGLARRGTKIAALRKENEPFLLLDAGMAFPRRKEQQEIKAEIILEVMDYLHYTAYNPGKNEFSLGRDFLADARERISVPLITSNIVYADRHERTWAHPYRIEEIGNVRVAVFGVQPDDVFGDHESEFSDLVVLPPARVLNTLIPRVREKVDLVILLSSRGYLDTVDLVEEVSGVDLAICSGRLASTIIKTEKPPVYQAGMKGEKLGIVRVSLDGESGEVTCEHSLAGLYANIPDDPKVNEIIRKIRPQH
jgi:2',3'-cyclic-nucleotide 2'-phosphodiesterase (5'-nucleotidase family)